MPNPMDFIASQEARPAAARSRRRTSSASNRPSANPTNSPTTGTTNIPTTPARTPTATGPLGMRSRRILRPVKISDALIPITARPTPTNPAVHDAVEPSSQAQTSSVPIVSNDPGRIGKTVPSTPAASNNPASPVTMASKAVVSMSVSIPPPRRVD